ncbi:MAG: HlyD family efflux transporter periplasmic adaptor subunit [Rhodovulum sp.]|nr:HlyD family efflux transporter periplasmic adaptor subunit [Rhodovulum sp.]
MGSRLVAVVALALAGVLVIGAPAPALAAPEGPAARAGAAVRSLIARLRGNAMPAGIVKSNGRIEATQVDVIAKYGGRLATLTVKEGDEVTAGQVVATIASPETEAQLKGAQAQVLRAKQALAEAIALIAQRSSDVAFTRTDLERGRSLLDRGNISQQVVDQRQNRYDAASAGLRAAMAQREQAEYAIQVAEADVQRFQAVLVDMVLVSPRSGRVQYRLARAGEVVAAGQRVLTILDLADVYLTLYLPADDAGKLALGDEARIVADPIPEYVIPATISFVATEAQFTPKSVETAEEREKLMFRVKLQVDPEVLSRWHRYVKTGVRGIGFVRTSPAAAWPKDLEVKLPK